MQLNFAGGSGAGGYSSAYIPAYVPGNGQTLTVTFASIGMTSHVVGGEFFINYFDQSVGFPFTTITLMIPLACFVSESNLLTPSGYKEAKDIKTGDLLMTADGRKVPVKAYESTLIVNKDTAPFLVPKNALGMGCPKADLRLSPWHAIQMNNGLWMKPQSFSELYPGSVEQYGLGKPVTYYHFEAPNFFKDNLVCDGTVVESYGADQLDNVKGRVYNYDAKLGGYTRISGKPAVAKKLMM